MTTTASTPAIRRATPLDLGAIQELLRELELLRPSLATGHFWVAEEGGAVVGIAHLEPAGDHLFVSSVGVRASHQGRGIATALLRKMLAAASRRVYLYTIIPTFFERFKFDVAPAPRALPPREWFGCDSCEKAKCVCMVKKPDVSLIP